MYHQTNLDWKSFSILEDLVETIVALTLNTAKYFWMIFWLMTMHHHTKFDWSEIWYGQTFTGVQNLHCDLDLEYSKATHSPNSPDLALYDLVLILPPHQIKLAGQKCSCIHRFWTLQNIKFRAPCTVYPTIKMPLNTGKGDWLELCVQSRQEYLEGM